MPSPRTTLNRLLIATAVPLVLAACSGGGPTMSAEQTTQALSEASGEVTQTQQSYASTDAGASLSSVPEMTTVFGSVLSSQSIGTLSHDGTTPQELDRHLYSWNDSLTDWDDMGDSGTGDLIHEWTYSHDSTNKTAHFIVDWDAYKPTITATNFETGSSEEVPVDLAATLKADMGGAGESTAGSAQATFGYYVCEGDTSTEVVNFDSNGSFGPVGERLTFDTSYALDESGTPDVITSTGEVDLDSGGKHVGFDWDFTVRGTMQRDGCVPLGFEPTSGSVSFSAAAGSHTVAFVANFDNIVKTSDPNKAVIDPDVSAVDLNGSLKINSKTALTFNGTFDDANNNETPGDNLMLSFAGESKTLEAYLQEIVNPAAFAALNFLR